MGWLITLGILTLLAVLPVGVSVKYDSDGPLVRLIVGPIKMTLFPRPQKEKKPKKTQLLQWSVLSRDLRRKKIVVYLKCSQYVQFLNERARFFPGAGRI